MLLLRSIFYLLFFSYSSVEVFAQVSIIPFSEYLNKQLDLIPSENNDQINYPEFNSALFDKIEIRTETDEFDVDRQEFQLRLSPNGTKYRKVEKAIYKDLIQDYQFRKVNSNPGRVVAIYELWIEAYYNLKKLEVFKKKEIVQNDLLTILGKNELNGEVDVLSFSKAKRESQKLKSRISVLQKRIKGWIVNSSEPVAIISIEDIQGYVLKLEIEELAYEDKARDLYKIQMLDNEYDKEKIENAKIFDFVQLRYRGPQVNPWEEKLSLALGFNMPKADKNSLNMVELELDKKRELQQINLKSSEYKNELEEKILSIQRSIDQYNEEKALLQQLSNLDQELINYSPSNKKDLVKLLEIKKDSHNDQIELIELEEEVYEEYLELLIETGQFRFIPHKNLFSKLY